MEKAKGPQFLRFCIPIVETLQELGGSGQPKEVTVTSAHGPWRVRRSPGLACALPRRDFAGLGVPHLPRDSLAAGIDRTAVYVTRTFGGVGGEKP